MMTVVIPCPEGHGALEQTLWGASEAYDVNDTFTCRTCGRQASLRIARPRVTA